AWLTALSASGGAMNGPPDRLGRLRQALDAWFAAAIPPDAPFRTCFRLEPPEGDSPDLPWFLDFLLQARDEPSLLVEAEAVWRAPDRLQLPGRIVEAPQELLLADLGRASRLWPVLERALHEATPAHLRLDAEGAHSFLKEGAPLLAQSGFGVLLPAWWRDQKEHLGARLVARPREEDGGTGLLGQEGLCDYRWEAALGEETLTIAELRNLAELKLPLVQLRGRWVEVRPDELRHAVQVLERQERDGTRQMTVPQVLRAAGGLTTPEAGLPVVGVDAQGWLRQMLREPNGWRPDAIAAPRSFHGELRPYQERGLGWLRFLDRQGLGACLADDMGLGKTIQMLALLLLEREEGEVPGPTLLVCPMSLVGNWQHETTRFAPSLRVHVHHGAGRLAGEEFSATAEDADLVLTTYSLAARDREVLASVRWGRVVLDEAQNIKNRESAQAHAVRTLPTERRVALTGTPLENRLSELWSIMDFCNPGLLGAAADFRRRFAVPIERYRDEESASLLRRLTGPFVLRRLKTDRSIIADLPEKVEIKVFCNITREQATLYQAILDDMLGRIQSSSGIARRGYVLATMTRLKQVLNHPAHLLHDGTALAGRSGKLQRLEEVLEEVLADGDRALCFTQYAEMGGLLQHYLTERLHQEILFLHGETPKAQRDDMVDRFQTGEGPSIFILSLKAGGTGLNLTAANHVIHFDRWWNPAVEDQATDRAFRIGQRRDVQVRKLICVGTLEERIDRMLEDKRALAQQIVGAGEGWLTELSTDELRDLVELSLDAVAE
ncbi:MAG: DEAD/DEAH box helicase, partial [Candidatus Dormibacteraceae bacterium]